MSHSAKLLRSTFGLLSVALALVVAGCAAQQELPYHGFESQAALDAKDQYVARESVGGKLDPKNLAQEGQKYVHDAVYYDRLEEGYYQWGRNMYQLGYRDVYYVRDFAPRAFRHELLDIYDHALATGFEDAQAADHK